MSAWSFLDSCWTFQIAYGRRPLAVHGSVQATVMLPEWLFSGLIVGHLPNNDFSGNPQRNCATFRRIAGESSSIRSCKTISGYGK